MMKKILFIFIIINIIVRILLGFVVFNKPVNSKENLASDEVRYANLSKTLIKTGDFSLKPNGKPFFKAGPIYPFLLAFLVKFNIKFQYIRIIQSLFLGIILGYIIYKICIVLFENKKIGDIAFIFTIYHPWILAFSFCILTEVIFLVFFSLSLLYIFKSIKYPNKKNNYLYAGILLGIATLTRPVTFFLPIIYIFLFTIYYIYKKKLNKKIIIGFFIFFISYCIIVSIWTIRNYIASNGKFIPVITGGQGLWSGHLQAKYGPLKYRQSKEYKKNVLPGDDPIQRNERLKKLGIDLIKNHTKEFMYYIIVKLKKLWFYIPGQELVLKKHLFIMYSLLILYYLFIILFFIGIILNKNKDINIFIYILIFYFSLLHSFNVANARYRLPFEIIMICFVSFSIEKIISKLKKLH